MSLNENHLEVFRVSRVTRRKSERTILPGWGWNWITNLGKIWREPTYCSACLTARYSNNFPTLSNIYIYIVRLVRFFTQLTGWIIRSIGPEFSPTSLRRAKSCAFVIIEIHARHLHKRVRVYIQRWMVLRRRLRSVDPHAHQSRV